MRHRHRALTAEEAAAKLGSTKAMKCFVGTGDKRQDVVRIRKVSDFVWISFYPIPRPSLSIQKEQCVDFDPNKSGQLSSAFVAYILGKFTKVITISSLYFKHIIGTICVMFEVRRQPGAGGQ